MKIFVFSLTLVAFASCEFSLQILHTNDIHSRFEETDKYSGSCSPEFSSQRKCFGGYARLKAAADAAKEEAKRRGVPTVFLNAGDNFVGTLFYIHYKWKIVAEFVDKLGFDVMTLGNHEFDEGVSELASYLKAIRTPVVCSNLDLASDRRLEVPILTRSKVLTVEGRRIGVIGYLTPDTVRISKTEKLRILPEIESVRAEAKRLKADGVNIIIGLGHSGFETDLRVAAEVEEMSVVVGAHSHTMLYTPRDKSPAGEWPISEYPTMVTQKSGKKVPVVQAYAYSKYLGQLFVQFNDEGEVVKAEGNPVLLDGSIEKDRKLDKEIAKWTVPIRQRFSTIQGYTRVPLLKSDFQRGQLESTFGNLITDAIVDQVIEYAKEIGLSRWTRTAVALFADSSIRDSIYHEKYAGGLTMEDLVTAFPFGDTMMEVALYGRNMRTMLEFSVHGYDAEKSGNELEHFLHVSGLRVVYDFSKKPGNRVQSVEILCTECEIPRFVALEDNRVYHVVATKYLVRKGNKNYMIGTDNVNTTEINTKEIDILVRYLKKNQIVYPKLDGRITVKGFKPMYSSAMWVTSSGGLILGIVMVFFIR